MLTFILIGTMVNFFIIGILIDQILFLRKELSKKFALRPGEYLSVTTLKFGENIEIYRADNMEPIDCIAIVEFSNVAKPGNPKDGTSKT